MMMKEITPRVAGPGTGDAPAPQVGSIVVLSDDEVEKVAGGQDAWKGEAQHTYSLLWEHGRLTGFVDGKQMWTT